MSKTLVLIIFLIIIIILFKNKENFSFDNYKQSIDKTYKLTDINASELTNTNIINTQTFSAENFIGIIVAWSGSIESIPSGWALCDGSTYKDSKNIEFFTPDLRSRFILGASRVSTSPIMVRLDNSGDSDVVRISSNDASNNVIFLTPKTIGTKGGEEKHTLTYEEFPSHKHDIPVVAYGGEYRTCDRYSRNSRNKCEAYSWKCSTSSAGPESKTNYAIGARIGSGYANSYTGINKSGESKPHDNMHPYYTLAYIIKIS